MEKRIHLNKQTIYDLMTGQLNLEEFPVLGSEQIQDEFAEGCPAINYTGRFTRRSAVFAGGLVWRRITMWN